MVRVKRNKSHRWVKLEDRRTRDLARNAEVAPVEVDNPLGLEPGDKIVALRSIRNDPLGRLHSHRQIDEVREYVDGVQAREPITEGQRQAMLRLNRAERELGADGSALVHDVLVRGMTMDQVGQRRCLQSQRWKDYFARRFQECLDRLALLYGFATDAKPRLARPSQDRARE